MLLRHSIIYILAKMVPAIMAFAALSMYTHFLSPSEYGLYTLIFTGSVFLHNAIFNWLPAGTLRFWSNKSYDQSTFISTLGKSYLRILFGLLIITALLVAYYWGRPEATWAVITYLLLVSLAIYTITQSIFSVKIKPTFYAYLTISYSVLALLAGTIFAYLGYGAIGVLVGIAIGLLIPPLFAFKETWLPYKKADYDKQLFKKLWAYGLPLASATLLEEVTKISDRFMLAGLQDNAQAGLYAVGYDLSGNSILMIMSAINLAAYPVIIRLLDEEGEKPAMEYFHKYVILLLGVSVPSVIGLNLVGPDLVYLLIDEQFQESVIFLLPWITSAIFLMGLQVFYFYLAFQLGHHVISIVKIGIIIVIVNLSLNYFLIPSMGIKGAAIATLSSFAVGSILSAIMGRKHFSLPFPFLEFTKIVFSALVMGVCLWWFKDFRGWGWLALQISVGIASYTVMMIAFNILNIRTKILEHFKS